MLCSNKSSSKQVLIHSISSPFFIIGSAQLQHVLYLNVTRMECLFIKIGIQNKKTKLMHWFVLIWLISSLRCWNLTMESCVANQWHADLIWLCSLYQMEMRKWSSSLQTNLPGQKQHIEYLLLFLSPLIWALVTSVLSIVLWYYSLHFRIFFQCDFKKAQIQTT